MSNKTKDSVGIASPAVGSKNMAEEEIKKDVYGKIESLDAKVKKAEEKMTKIEEESEKMNRESVNRMVQILTIFIGFFTFISVEMQIFKNVTNWNLAIALSLVLLGSIMIFVTTINWLFKDSKEQNNWRQIIISILSLLFIAVGVWLIYNSKYRNDDYILKENLSDYYTKQEFDNKFIIENQKTQNILNCARYSDAFWKYKECIK